MASERASGPWQRALDGVERRLFVGAHFRSRALNPLLFLPLEPLRRQCALTQSGPRIAVALCENPLASAAQRALSLASAENQVCRSVLVCEGGPAEAAQSGAAWVFLLRAGDLLHPCALLQLAHALAAAPDAQLAYTDSCLFAEDSLAVTQYRFLPDFAPETLLGNVYFSGSAAVRTALLQRWLAAAAHGQDEAPAGAAARGSAAGSADGPAAQPRSASAAAFPAASGAAFPAASGAASPAASPAEPLSGPVPDAAGTSAKMPGADGYPGTAALLWFARTANGAVHVPANLVWLRKSTQPAPDPAADTAALACHLQALGLPAAAGPIDGAPGFYRLRSLPAPAGTLPDGENRSGEAESAPRSGEPLPPADAAPLVSILIPTRDGADVLARCLASLYDRTSGPAFEVLILDNGSTQPETAQLFARCSAAHENFRVLACPGPFNFSALNNAGAAAARGQYLVLLNSDTEVLTPDWLQELLLYAAMPQTGAVGALLLYPDGTVQHAGLVLGIQGPANHAHRGEDPAGGGYLGRLRCAQDVSAVTGACLMVEKAKWQRAGGMDEALPVAYNDVAFCLALGRLGLRCVFTPFAVLRHYESVSRGQDVQGENRARLEAAAARMQAQWHVGDGCRDPYYNPNLSTKAEDFRIELQPLPEW